MKTQITSATIVLLAFGVSTALAAGGCNHANQAASSSSTQEAPRADIVQTAQQAGQFTTLVAALQAADLVDALQGPGPFTVFAPTDKAFAALPQGTVESLLMPENKAKLQSILKYHVVAGRVMSSDLMKYTDAMTLQGEKVDLTLMINDARVAKADIKTTNGVIHVVDRVMLPGATQPISGHATSEAPDNTDKTIVETAIAAGQFNTLVTALQAAGLVDALNGDGPFTVFAPTDSAFAKLPAGTLESLVRPENQAQLQAILKYHVIPARLGSNDILAAHTVKTLNGQPIYPSLLIDDAGLQIKNIYCRNGVIHVIERVILPKETS